MKTKKKKTRMLVNLSIQLFIDARGFHIDRERKGMHYAEA